VSIYRAIVHRWIDGDTLDCRVNRRHGLWEDIRVRVAGVSAPETRGPGRDPWGLGCLARARTFAPEGSEIELVDWGEDEEDAFGRWLCGVSFYGEDLATSLIQGGWAVPYEDRRNHDWLTVSAYPMETTP
jgi:endonuclease YncB( thermonuclease family)